jgi:hypothetical protein
MKNTLLAILFLFPFISMGQEDAFGPSKKDNMIIVTTDTVDRQALNKAAKSLTEMGFTIKTKDAVNGTATTNPYDYKKGKLVLNVLVALNEIKIYGDYEPNLALLSGDEKPKPLKNDIAFEGNKGSAVKDAWNIMDAFANQLTQVLKGTVSYAKR